MVTTGLRSTLAGLAVVFAAASLSGCGGASATPTRVVQITIAGSHYQPDFELVPTGVPTTYVVRNTDPIDHELIIGDAAVHAAHEKGTEAHHGSRPGEITIPSGTVVRTNYVPRIVGRLEFACHLPGHWAYGMRGVLIAR